MVHVPMLQCITTLALGLLGLTWLRRKWGKPEALVGGFLLGGLGLWLSYLTLFLLNSVGDKLLVLVDDLAAKVGAMTIPQAAAAGAWLAFTRMLLFEVALLVGFIALFGMTVGRVGSGGVQAIEVAPMSNNGMSVRTPLRGWALWFSPVLFTCPIAPMFGAVLGVALASGQDARSALRSLITWFPVAVAVVTSLVGMAVGCWSLRVTNSHQDHERAAGNNSA